jgi:hypothetical protein
MSDIFISYASEERQRVLPLINALEKTGWSVFWDRTIPAGKTWRQIIGAEIRTCRSVVVVWTESSVTSEWVLEEAETGKRRQILIPVLLDEVEPPFGFGNIQAANLTGWNGDNASPSFTHLVTGIAAILGPVPMAVKEVEECRLLAEEPRKADDNYDDEVLRIGKSAEKTPSAPNELLSLHRDGRETSDQRNFHFSWKLGFRGFSALLSVTLICILAIYLVLSQSPYRPIGRGQEPETLEKPPSEEKTVVQAPPITLEPQKQITAPPQEKVEPRKEIEPQAPVRELKQEKPIATLPVLEEAKRREEQKRQQAKVTEPARKTEETKKQKSTAATLRSPEAAGRVVSLRNVLSTEAGDVSGEVVNNSKQTLRDVRLQILYSWRWKNEHQPGKDDPGKAIYHVLEQEIAPGQTVRFNYKPSPPFASREDGQFDIGVKIVSFAEVFQESSPR